MEVRKDYILDRYAYFAPERKKRLRQFKKEEKVDDKLCFFCPGNENLTPPEIRRVEEKGRWIIRVIPNKFPAVELKKCTCVDKKFFNKTSAYGKHEVIIETNDHKKQLWDLSKEHITKILNVYEERIRELEKIKGINYVQVFKNHGRQGGTSLVHSHTQITALDKVPTLVKEKINAVKKFKACPYCQIINQEAKSERMCLENKDMIAIAPYASRFNYEVWIFPKRHKKKLTELNEDETKSLAEILRKILVKLKKVDFDYNFFLHEAPKGSDLHFHIEVTPRIATWAGFELSTGMIINSVMPEDAAKFYRD